MLLTPFFLICTMRASQCVANRASGLPKEIVMSRRSTKLQTLLVGNKTFLGFLIFFTLISSAAAQTWVLTGNMAEQRARHSAVLLCDGRVLVLGSAGHAELYDPGTRTFTPTGTMNT